jgi:hypothetical protein
VLKRSVLVLNKTALNIELQVQVSDTTMLNEDDMLVKKREPARLIYLP